MITRLRNRNHATKAEIRYYKGEFGLAVDGLFSAMFVKYTGNFNLRSIASGFKIIKGKKNFIISTPCMRELKESVLFTYGGAISVQYAKMYNYTGGTFYPKTLSVTHAVQSQGTTVENMAELIENMGTDKNTQNFDRKYIKLEKKNKKKYRKLSDRTKTGASQVRGGQSGSVETGGGGGGY